MLRKAERRKLGEEGLDLHETLVNAIDNPSQEQIDIIHHFASNILDNIKDLEPEFSKTVDENFWDLI